MLSSGGDGVFPAANRPRMLVTVKDNIQPHSTSTMVLTQLAADSANSS